jgi:hypothetical protein
MTPGAPALGAFTAARPPEHQRRGRQREEAAVGAVQLHDPGLGQIRGRRPLELTALLADDVVLEMPPMWNWYRGRDDFGAFMRRVVRTRGEEWRTVPLWANG